MTSYFFDSSALAKRYTQEIGTVWVQSITTGSSGNTIVVASITSVEMMSAIMRQRRDGKIKPRIAKTIRLLIDRHMTREYISMSMSDPIVQGAKDLLEQHPLRAYDAVQLASALEANGHLIVSGLSPLVFISADTRLLGAASKEGLTIDNPDLHP
jgi:predicted nucleic acid-binding protein